MRRMLLASWLLFLGTMSAPGRGGEVSGRVTMPEVCSPAISPAVVTLEPFGDAAAVDPGASTAAAEVALIDQRGLQFTPRVQAIALGQSVRFTNEDNETHNVHVGNDFNESMSPGQPRTSGRRGPGSTCCSATCMATCGATWSSPRAPGSRSARGEGRFHLRDVPDGRYVLNVWHEMGTPLRREVVVAGGGSVDLSTLALTVPAIASGGGKRTPGANEPARTWARVIEKIGMLLASSLDASSRPGGLKAARKLAEDAYWGEFEASNMETAVRIHLGFAAAGVLEGQFRAMVAGVRDVAEGRQPAEHATELSRKLLLGLIKAADELNRKGVTDPTRISGIAVTTSTRDIAEVDENEQQRQIAALKRGFARVADLADRGEPDDAASAMTAVYFEEFEPIERFVDARKPQDVRPLEMRFNAIRGDVSEGLKGGPLASSFATLQAEVESSLGRSAAQPAGTFGPAFANSFVIIVREGVEVILLLAMLIALAVKTGEGEGRNRAMRAIAWGVSLAIVASLGTAIGLNLLVSSAQGRTRELIEGLVMLAAAGVLFYVSYWLISQSESRRWLDFLKRQARRGVELGGRGTLALTAFLAVFREGAETALMYQAMLGSQGQSRAGLLGLAAGLVAGLLVLAVVALLVRATSVRLPMRAFFKLSGAVLFGMAVVFAGNAIFELQVCGLLKTTTLDGPLAWLGQGIPILGLYPNVQTLSIQGLLLAGAALAMVLMLSDRPASESRVVNRPTAGVGV